MLQYKVDEEGASPLRLSGRWRRPFGKRSRGSCEAMAYTDYLFDFDGTLVDSMPSYAAAMLRLLDEGGIAYGDDIIKRITPLGYLGTARYYVEELGLALPVDEAVERMRRYAYDEYAYRIGAKATVIETLTALAAEGAGLHILTASPHAVLDVCLGRLGMLSLFKNVWSCDDFKTSKADPEIYKMAAERTGCGSECDGQQRGAWCRHFNSDTRCLVVEWQQSAALRCRWRNPHFGVDISSACG